LDEQGAIFSGPSESAKPDSRVQIGIVLEEGRVIQWRTTAGDALVNHQWHRAKKQADLFSVLPLNDL
jgi:hypothetical protein